MRDDHEWSGQHFISGQCQVSTRVGHAALHSMRPDETIKMILRQSV